MAEPALDLTPSAPAPAAGDTAAPPAAEPQDLDSALLDQYQEDAAGDAGDAGADEELDDVEYEGKQYRLPKELRDALLRQSDYTRKTQELASQQRAHASQQQQLQVLASIQAQTQQEMLHASNLQARLSQFEGVDWTRFSEQDPVNAQKMFFEYQRLKDEFSAAAGTLQQRQLALFNEHRAQRDKLIQEGRQALARDIKGWSPQLAEEIVKYGTSEGYADWEVRGVVDPRMLRTLDKARRWDQLVAKASKRGQPVDTPPPEPAPTVHGRAASTANPNRMSTEDWMRWRNREIAKR